MPNIPLNQKFQSITGTLDTSEKRSDYLNSLVETYTMQDLIDTVGDHVSGGGGGVDSSAQVAINVTDIATNVTDIAANVTDIAANAASATVNAAAIAAIPAQVNYSTDIAANTDAIAAIVPGTDSTAAVAQNVTDIATNTAAIAAIPAQVDYSGDIATNAAAIVANDTDIALNTAKTGITTQQAADIINNNNSSTAHAAALALLSPVVPGIELEAVTRSVSVNATGESEGSVLKFGTTTGLTAGKVYVFNGTDWVAVKATDVSTTKGLLGLALGTTSAAGMLVEGIGFLSHDPGAAGDLLYISTSATTGLVTGTQPSTSGDIVRTVGYCLADNKVFFSPSQSYIEIA